MHTMTARPAHDQSIGEEIANSVSHGLALVAVLVGTPFLLVHAVRLGDPGFVVGASVFAATMILLYLASTLYHALTHRKAKHVFRVIDHSAIFLLIAGTYTPFTLGVLHGPWGWTLFGVVWGLAVVGIALRAFNRFASPMLSTAIYLLMGWLVVIAIDPLIARLPTAGLLWLVAGGLAYSVGVIFFALGSRLKYGHFTWHVFVMAGTVCHYFAVLGYAA